MQEHEEKGPTAEVVRSSLLSQGTPAHFPTRPPTIAGLLCLLPLRLELHPLS